MSNYDQRQYILMKQFLEGFEAGNIKIIVLINSLRGLVNALEETDNDWKKSFNRKWWVLEEIYSIASDRGETHFSAENSKEILEAVHQMKRMVDNVIL
jgi:hypothetical protein